MTTPSRSICLFCGSETGRDPRYAALAAAFGAAIAEAGVRLVYGGGAIGLMGEAARAARAAGGRVLGVIPEFLTAPEIMYREVEQIVVPTLHDRKRVMAEQSDAFVVLPGGVGTLEEAVEFLSWARLGLHAKPTIFLDDDGYWDAFFAMMDHQIEAGFTPASMHELMARAHTPAEAITLALAATAAA